MRREGQKEKHAEIKTEREIKKCKHEERPREIQGEKHGEGQKEKHRD
jgi:hypothetical protein